MSLMSWVKKEIAQLIMHKCKRFLLRQTSSLKSVKYLSVSPVQEVEVEADLKCVKCRKRVGEMISKIDDLESVVVHVQEKKVTLIRKSNSR